MTTDGRVVFVLFFLYKGSCSLCIEKIPWEIHIYIGRMIDLLRVYTCIGRNT